MQLSISSANLFTLCEFRYYLEKIQGWRLKKEQPWLHYGSAVDDLLSIWDTEGFEASIQAVSRYFDDPYTQIDVVFLLTLYTRLWLSERFSPEDLDGQKGNQYYINEKLTDEVTFHGYVDKVHMYNDYLGFTERKTTSQPINDVSAYWNKLELDPQITGYAWGMSQKHIEPVNLCNYEVLRKPSKALSVKFVRKDKSGEAIPLDEYKENVFSLLTSPPKQTIIARKKVFITSDRMEWWKDDHINTATRIIDCARNSESVGERAYRRNPNSCDAFGGCPFKPYCAGKCDLERIEIITKEKKDG